MTLPLALLGTDLKKTPIPIWEKLAMNTEETAEFLTQWKQKSDLEIVPLSTCNRIEYYVAGPTKPKITTIQSLIAEIRNIPIDQLDCLHYSDGIDSLTHLFEVVSGVHSVVFGESEILRQVKSAYAMGVAATVTGPFLNKIFQSVIALGKRVRKETGISRGAISISSIAVDELIRQVGHTHPPRIAIIGAGLLGARAVKKLKALGCQSIAVTTRSADRLPSIHRQWNVDVFPLTDLFTQLAHVDGAIFALDSSRPIAHPPDFQSGIAPLVIIDLGVPRNVDPSVGECPGITLVGMNELSDIANKTLAQRERYRAQILATISEAKSDFFDWYRVKLTAVA